jgi:hypothetical protein
MGARAARRLSTSAIDTIREHDYGSPEPRRTPPAVAHQRSHSRGRHLSMSATNCGWRRLLRGAASRGHGSGAVARSARLEARHLPPRSLTVEASPQPDRLGHLLSPARCEHRFGAPASPGQLGSSCPSRACLDEDREAMVSPPRRREATGKGRLPHSPAKRSAFRCTRGAFHRRMSPFRGSPGLPQAVPSLWNIRAGAFCVPPPLPNR